MYRNSKTKNNGLNNCNLKIMRKRKKSIIFRMQPEFKKLKHQKQNLINDFQHRKTIRQNLFQKKIDPKINRKKQKIISRRSKPVLKKQDKFNTEKSCEFLIKKRLKRKHRQKHKVEQISSESRDEFIIDNDTLLTLIYKSKEQCNIIYL